MNNYITPDELSETICSELNNYNRAVIKGAKDEAKKHMDQLVKETKKTAPKRSGDYKKSITSKKEWENSLGAGYIWYVKSPHYRLSHLLENGHATRNGGRTHATHFIKNASDPIIESYIKSVEEVIRNGG